MTVANLIELLKGIEPDRIVCIMVGGKSRLLTDAMTYGKTYLWLMPPTEYNDSGDRVEHSYLEREGMYHVR